LYDLKPTKKQQNTRILKIWNICDKFWGKYLYAYCNLEKFASLQILNKMNLESSTKDQFAGSCFREPVGHKTSEKDDDDEPTRL